MWPWEHLAFGYLVYSLFTHAVFRESPTASATFATAFATQFPDLLDKPLSWVLKITATGYSVGHSLFVAPLVCLLAVALARRRGTTRAGVAFAVGYLSHLFGDVVYPLFLGRGPAPWAVLWPVAPQPAVESHAGFFAIVGGYLLRYAHQMAALEVTPYLLFQLGLALSVLLLWVYDGLPGVAAFRRFVGRRMGS